MVPKHELFESIPLHIQELNYGKNVYEQEDHVEENTFTSNLLLKLGLAILFISFLIAH
jgi:uncharacterized protein YqhQ